MTNERDGPSVAEVADALGFELSASALDDSVAAAEQLAGAAATVADVDEETTTATPDPIQLNDDYGALLWGYETSRKSSSGPLNDLSVVVKDNVAIAGLPLTCGSAELSYTPRFDATLVERLLNDGAAVRGKANMDAFAFGPSGEFSGIDTVRNPLDPDRVPGGSSSGSGVAVAAGEADVAIGTDTGGSVRIPAACCGVVGMKPSFGTVSRHGIVPFAPSLDTAGPLAQTVDDAARVLRSIRGPDLHDATTGVRGVAPGGLGPDTKDPEGTDRVETVGVPEAFLEACSETVRERFETAISSLDPNLCIESVSVPLGAVEEAYLLIGATEFSWWIRQTATVRGLGATYDNGWAEELSAHLADEGLSDHVAKRVLPSAYLDARENGGPYRAARREAAAFRERVDRALEETDVLCLPTIRTLPPERGEVTANDRLFDLLGNTAPFNLSGHPAVSVPLDTAGKLPVSAQFVAPLGADGVALDAARIAESESR